ncbi:kinase-like domain-containing protein [Xylariaceae sp. FL0255]|nr:kinase-like domain-containing protein [Xylariaceae sp. FL0255]
MSSKLPSDSMEDYNNVPVIQIRNLGLHFAASRPSTLPNLSPSPLSDPINGTSTSSGGMDTKTLRNRLGLLSKTKTTVESTIRECIQKRAVCVQGGDLTLERYLPISDFDEIFSNEIIECLLKEQQSLVEGDSLQDRIDKVLVRRRILGILIYMKSLDLFEQFVSKNIRDDQLPFKQSTEWSKLNGPQTGGRLLSEEDLFRHWNWDDNEIVLFRSYQSMFFVPFLNMNDNLYSYVLHRGIRLPWKKCEAKSNGGNGIVHKLEIHPAHHNFNPTALSGNNPLFALKEINTFDENVYKDELNALAQVGAKVHEEKHLIKLLLTFQHGPRYYFLFEWADSNLQEFWERHDGRPGYEFYEPLWAAQQLHGLATAVKRIHGLASWQKNLDHSQRSEYGRHGDIKPNNILWFSSSRTGKDLLVLSDLGLTRFHSLDTRSKVAPSRIDGYTGRYRPPEMEVPNHQICSKYDIWSLGCVYLEFCIWWREGSDGLEKFAYELKEESAGPTVVKEDNFFTVRNGQASVKQVVEKWIKRLIKENDGFTTPMLELISSEMLVVSQTDRVKSDFLCTHISHIVKRLGV